jgi:ATP-binding cassette, subfamily C (CFTR/MRP), member 4
MYITASQAFGFALDVLCTLFVCCVTFSFLITDSRQLHGGASVGLAISQSMALTAMLQWGIRQSAEVANQLMAVERVLEYRDLEKEEKGKKIETEMTWPEKGKIKFRNLVYRYAVGTDPVLKDLCFEVNSCEKIGIVGRTGVSLKIIFGNLC